MPTKTSTKPMLKDRNGRRNPRVKAKDPETGEDLILPETAETGEENAKPPGGHGRSTIAEKALYIQKAEQQLRWAKLKNEEKEKALQAKLGNLVDREQFMNQVLAANQIVKQQILAVIERANLSHESRARLRHEMIAALNELAYERGSNHTAAR